MSEGVSPLLMSTALFLGVRDSENESGDEKASQQSSSPESGICNSCDRQSLLSSHLPAATESETIAWGNVTHTGGKLCVPDSG